MGEFTGNRVTVALYTGLELTVDMIPKEALAQAKENTEWAKEIAPGIELAVWYAQDGRPDTFYRGIDGEDGYKYGVVVAYQNERIQELDQTVRLLDHMYQNWADFFDDRMGDNPTYRKSNDIFFANDQNQMVVWTRDEEMVAVLLEGVAQAMRNLAVSHESEIIIHNLLEGNSAPEEKKEDPLAAQFREKYKDVADEDAADYYYGADNAMDRVLAALQGGIDRAGEIYEGLKGSYNAPHVGVYIDQDNYRMSFSVSEYDEDEGELCGESKEFYVHEVGETMAEALVLMQKMEDSDVSTGISQATNNWVEDLSFDALGEFTMDVDVADSCGYIDY